MKGVFLIRIGSKLFEPIRKNSSKYIVTHEDITSIDDEGDPEDFSIDYSLELLKYDDKLI